MIIIETKTNVHIFHDTDIYHVDYNRELNKVSASVVNEGLCINKTFDDVLNVRYMTDYCPTPYEFKSSEQARLLRELEERINLDTLNLKITRSMRGLYCLMKEGNSKAEEQQSESICKMFEERNKIYDRINEIRKESNNK